MWLFTKKGFFSIVQHEKDPNLLLVRARVRGDIEKYWPWAVIERYEDRDYLYRANIPRFEVVNAIAKMAHDIDYTDYKASIDDKSRSRWYFGVWQYMADMQDVFQAKERAHGRVTDEAQG